MKQSKKALQDVLALTVDPATRERWAEVLAALEQRTTRLSSGLQPPHEFARTKALAQAAQCASRVLSSQRA